MVEKEKAEGVLSPYRVLDLADEKGLLCGKLLGDLGADVIKIERPGGDPARSLGPFYHDEPDPEKSLFWFAFNTSKRGITLDIKTADGQEIFKKLVKSADFVIESFDPGYMDKLGLGYSVLERVNPGVIMVSITPFGPTGPYKDYKAPDIVAWAAGGKMYQFGDADRPPVQISHHSQAYLHAGAQAAVGAMMALYHRQMTGEGQQVDVSIQEAVVQVNYTSIPSWSMRKVIERRGEQTGIIDSSIRLTQTWPCQDGYVYFTVPSGLFANRILTLIEWMESEGVADDLLKVLDWDTLDHDTMAREAWSRLLEPTQEVVTHLEEPLTKFFMARTKAELLEGALKHRVMLYPIATTTDLLESVQLDARGFWVKLEHPELGSSITYPGAFARASEAPPRVLLRAPLIGEHNQEIYEKELGVSREELLILKQARVI